MTTTFSLTAAELEQISRVVFAQVDVLQENLPEVLHTPPAIVRETARTLALEMELGLCRVIRRAGRSPQRSLPTKARADLHAALYETVRAATLKKHSERVSELLAEEINRLTAELPEQQQGESKNGTHTR